MINAFFTAILKILVGIISVFMTIFTFPLLTVLTTFFPAFSNYMDSFYAFFDDLLNGLAFAREVFFNITGFPRPLFIAIIDIFLAKITWHLTLLAYKFCVNVWHIIRGQPLEYHAVGQDIGKLKKDAS